MRFVDSENHITHKKSNKAKSKTNYNRQQQITFSK